MRAAVLELEALPAWVRLSPLVPTERPLVDAIGARLRGGDSRAMERVIGELLPSVRRWALRAIGPHPDLDDAVQDSLAEIASALRRFEGRSSVSTLAHRIVIRTVMRHVGRRKTVPLDVEREESDAVSPEQASSDRQRAARLYHHLAELSEPRRTAFVLCAIEELTPTEAAEIAGCSAVAMRSRLFDARRELEQRIAKDPVLSRTAAKGGAR